MNVVVVGGGFGGIKAALELSKRHIGQITLISNEPYFTHHATLYSTATGKDYAESIVRLSDIFAHHPNVTIVEDEMISIEPQRHLIIGKHKQYHYDKAVLALGSVTTFFGIEGMATNAYGIKSLEEVKKFQDHIHDEVVDQKLDKEYFIVGAGPTGVELAGALQEYLNSLIKAHNIKHSHPKVSLVEAAPRILPRMSETAAKLVTKRLKKKGIKVQTNKKVQALSDKTITVDGKEIPTTTAVWTSGVANNPFFTSHGDVFSLQKNGRVEVDKYLEALPNVYVVGDSNNVAFSGMAWPAMKQATFVAKHLTRLASKRPTFAYRPHAVLSGLPVGHNWGYVEKYGIYVAGRPGYTVRRWMELYGYHQLMPFSMARAIWHAHDISEVHEDSL